MIQPTPAMNVDGGNDTPFFLGSEPDPARTRLGIIVLVIGLLMVFWAWGSWVYRVSADPSSAAMIVQTAETEDGAPTADQIKAASAMKLLLIVGFILFLAVLLGTFIMVRSARRYREAASRARAAPTAATDAWAMHRLPESDGDPDAPL